MSRTDEKTDPVPAPVGWRAYVAIARPDHWIKHIIIVPGVAAAFMTVGGDFGEWLTVGPLSFLSAMAVSSANYVINEWLDAGSDKHHPTKKARPGAMGHLSRSIVVSEYVVLLLVGLALARVVNIETFGFAFAFALAGFLYNVPPIRLKDRPYLDVLSEAVNNPLRVAIGWVSVSPTLPPLSLFVIFWFGAAFIMAVKRLSEYRFIVRKTGRESAVRYRFSFRGYSERSLLLSSFAYALLTAFGTGVFLIKYRTEYVFALPLFAALFCYYFWIGLADQAITQTPERLHGDRLLMQIVGLLVVVLAALSLVDLPWIDELILSVPRP